MLLAYKGEPNDMDAVARYQRNHLGAVGDETAIIELSAHHAVSMDVQVDRTAHRQDRIDVIQRRLDDYHPRFVVFYGRTYQGEYERVIGAPFRNDGSVWRGNTFCVLTTHPVAPNAPPPTYWIALGNAIRTTLDQGAGAALPAIEFAGAKVSARIPRGAMETFDDNEDVIIMRAGAPAGRIVREGKSVRVESREADGSHRVLGYYERSEASTFPRKVREIDDIFDAWRVAKIGDGSDVKVSWRKREFVPAFREQRGAMTHGCSVVEDDGVPIAYVYKIAPISAMWVDA